MNSISFVSGFLSFVTLSRHGEESRDRLLPQPLICGAGLGSLMGRSGCRGPRAGLWQQGRTGLGQRMDEFGAWQDEGQKSPSSTSPKPSVGGCWALMGVCTRTRGDYTRLQLSNKIIPAAGGDAEGRN